MDFEIGLDFEASLVEQMARDGFQPKNDVYKTLGIVPDNRRMPPLKSISATFELPSSDKQSDDTIDEQVLSRYLLLEDVNCTNREISGMVRVANIGFSKTVKIRYTRNNWRTSEDIIADYVPYYKPSPEKTSCPETLSANLTECKEKTEDTKPPVTERFAFVLPVPKDFGVGSRLEFAICYEVNGQTIWDNNNGQTTVSSV
ncbi:protein phosphatase 1 regulatory subunit 3B-like [Saccoglossus kowalevskii]|uniref:Protein phosphatase 1 regulatory subunit 3B-like n=1 Tax=Saccoglossus kowalevskii TaxID=10224 RepID=A0ABM0MQT4_SACKO|nr:PREDICTED: protein phosphatase 1 regulatory subunit 3B-like [Saccoglossus kowalevskii]